MSRQDFLKTPNLLNYLLNENEPITERLTKYNEHECLAFVKNTEMLYSGFSTLFKDNQQYQQEFEKAKNESIREIHKKQKQLNYEDFLRYLFFEVGRTDDHYGKQSLSTFETNDADEPFVYNIVPYDKIKAEIFERVAIEHIKTMEGKGLGKNGFIRLNKKLVSISYNSFETLEKQFKERLSQQFADKTRVIEYYHKKYIDPLKDTEISSRFQNIYNALKSGTTENHLRSHYYGYYTDKAKVIELLKLEEYLHLSKSSENTQSEMAKREYIPKPCFKAELIDSVTNVLNAYFDGKQHAELKRIIKTGSNANEKLLFRDNGNRLTDYFRRLFESDTITGCTKKDLIKWIIENFRNIYRGAENDYKFKTVEKTISGENNPCKNPIIE